VPIGKVWTYRLLFVFCIFVCVCTVMDLFAEDKAGGIKFCTAFVVVQCRESPIFVNFAPPEAQNRRASRPRGLNSVEMRRRKLHACAVRGITRGVWI